MKLLLLASVFSTCGLWNSIIDQNHTPFPQKNYTIMAENSIGKNSVTHEGTLMILPSTKSVESFCATSHEDGNNYSLKKANGSVVLLDLSDYDSKDIKPLLDKKVEIKGYSYTKNREVNDYEARPLVPIAPDFDYVPRTKGGKQSVENFPKISNFSCQIFYVEELSY